MNAKNIVIVISFSLFLILFLILNIIIPDNDISFYERRKLKQLPDITYKKIINGSYMDEFDGYSLDQFVFRDNFRKIKTIFELDILNKKDIGNSFIYDGGVYVIEYPLNEKSIYNATNKINYIIDKYLENNNIYYTIIPDKNYYLENFELKLDYTRLVEIMNNNLDIVYIDIFNKLSLDDYYKTDLHFMNYKLLDLKNYLNDNMHNKNSYNSFYMKDMGDFYGAYYGKLLKNVDCDKLIYLTNSKLNNLKSYNYENNTYKSVYDLDKVDSIDKYDIFLSGPVSIIDIVNDDIDNDKELIIFRDSFASSIAPFFALDYKRVTLIDIRYISSDLLGNYIDFTNQDVLFMYSVPILNNSSVFK